MKIALRLWAQTDVVPFILVVEIRADVDSFDAKESNVIKWVPNLVFH